MTKKCFRTVTFLVTEVARSVTAQRLVDERRDLEHDALPHRKPVAGAAQARCDLIA